VEREEHRMARTPGYRSSKATLEKLANGYLLYSQAADEGREWDNFRVRNIGLALQREIAEKHHGDPDAMKRSAGRIVVRTLGVETSSQLGLVLGQIPELRGWTEEEKAGAGKILRAKESGAEAIYLRLMQRHTRLRAALLRMGS